MSDATGPGSVGVPPLAAGGAPAPRAPALVFGGTGAVGREALRALAQAGIRATFTFRAQADRARALATEYGHTAAQVDLADAAAVRRLCDALDPKPSLFLHCAAIVDGDWDVVHAVNVRSAWIATQSLAPSLRSIVFAAALDRAQSLPLPPAFAASQGALGALAMALAKERGRDGVRVNVAALGLLDDGLSRTLAPKLREDYLAFSALKRLGTPAEAAAAILWLALEAGYVNGKTVAFNGGI